MTLTADMSSVRVDKYLAEEIEFLSRTKVKECIEAHKVLVDGLPVKPSFILQRGEIIKIELPEIRPMEVKAENISLDIIYEDDNLIILNKPAGMVVHPGAGNYEGTLVNGLLYHFNKLSQLYGEQRPGIVHRLDKDTSGVMVVVKTDECHKELSSQFENRLVKKSYIGLVWGRLKQKEGVINTPIIRHPRNRKQFMTGERGRTAITKYRVRKEWDYFSLLDLFPKTGRTHQLRVHVSSINHPIFADEVYGGGKSREKGYLPEVRKQITDLFCCTNRQALHADSISFNHPKTGKRVAYSAPLPDDFQSAIDHLNDSYA